MTNEKILEAARRLVWVQPVRFSEEGLQPAEGEVLAHLSWMGEQVAAYLAMNRRDKALRWLGFMQGAAWAYGYVSINDLKEHNAPGG
jgi:hypothetical protein